MGGQRGRRHGPSLRDFDGPCRCPPAFGFRRRLTRTLGFMRNALAIVALSSCLAGANANPCTGIDRTLTQEQKATYAPAIEGHLNKQLGPDVSQHIAISSTDVLQQFRLGQWRIVYVNTHVSDEPFLVYSSIPNQAQSYITAWAGAAATNEGPSIRSWLIKQAPGIPKKLAGCFAWHVTQDRDM